MAHPAQIGIGSRGPRAELARCCKERVMASVPVLAAWFLILITRADEK